MPLGVVSCVEGDYLARGSLQVKNRMTLQHVHDAPLRAVALRLQ